MNTFLHQITDLHIRQPGHLAYGRLDTAPYLKRAIQTIARCPQPPTAVVLTGDLTDFGQAAEYEHLRTLLDDLPCPYYLLVGNHDDAEQLRSAFPGHSYLGDSGPLQYSVPIGGLQLIALDTTVRGHSHGELDATRLEWLALELEAVSHRPVVVAMHHPPFDTLIGHMDRIGLLKGREELARIITAHTHVERVICGHLHRAIDVRFGGTIASTAPSPAHQLVLDMGPDALPNWNLEPGGVRVHAWTAATGVVTHTLPVGEFEGPYPFHMEGQSINRNAL